MERASVRAAVAMLLATCIVWAPAALPATRPNIVLVLADDLGGGDLSSAGAPIRTPNIDRVGREGVTLSDAYASANVCTPSRAGLMTGRYPIRTGLAFGVIDADSTHGIEADETTLPEVLQGAGYRTALIGKWHLGHTPGHWPTRHGFDRFYGLPYSNDMRPLRLYEQEMVVSDAVDQDSLTASYTRAALQFIDESAGTPFFLLMSHTFPHIPLHASPAFRGRSAAGLYGDSVEELDWSVGQVLERLAALGLDDQTLVIFTSDNGAWFEGRNGESRGMKGLTWDGGYRVPFLARWPGRIPAGSRSAAITMNIDILPTLATLAGIDAAALPALDGRDIWGVLARGAASPHRDLLLFFNEDVAAVRTQQWKYLERAWYRGSYISFENLRGAMGFDYPLLFDMGAADPESYSVADRHPEVLALLQRRLQEARHEFQPLRTAPAQPISPGG